MRSKLTLLCSTSCWATARGGKLPELPVGLISCRETLPVALFLTPGGLNSPQTSFIHPAFLLMHISELLWDYNDH